MENIQTHDDSLPGTLHGQPEEIDILEYMERGKEIPHGRTYRTKVDCEVVRVDTLTPAGKVLLEKVGKRPCAFELIAEFVHCENQVVEPNETIDLRSRGLKGFITAHKEIVEIQINGKTYTIERGRRTVPDILAKVGQSSDAYILLEEKHGEPPMPVPPNQPVEICGCEEFHTQVQTGGSS